MAGAGYKLFQTGAVLTAADVNTYLNEQTIMVFNDASARTTALSGVLAEGMISYLKDTNAVEKYDGSAWSAIGTGDIEGVTAGTGLTGGGTSGTVTLNFDVANYGGGSYAAGKNKIINGDFNINQRGFSSVTSTQYTFDRFRMNNTGGTVTTTAQTFTLGTAPVAGYEGKNFIRIDSTGQSAAADRSFLSQGIESVRTLAGQTVTVSFWAKAGSGSPKVAVELVQSFGSGGSPSSSVFTVLGQVTLSTSWARYSTTVSLPSISGKTLGTANDDQLFLALWTSAGTDWNSRTNSLGIQTATIDFWGIQVEAGSVATAFQTATGTLAGELAACQRYYYLHASGTSFTFAPGFYYNATYLQGVIQFPVTMRTEPTLVASSGTDYYNFARNGGTDTYNSLTILRAAKTAASVTNTSEVSGTAGQAGEMFTNNASASIAFSAEL